MTRRALSSLRPLLALAILTFPHGFGGCASSSNQTSGTGVHERAGSEAGVVPQTPVSLTAEVDGAPFPVVPVKPATSLGRGAAPRVAIVGAVQQARLEPIRSRPEPMLYGLLTGHEPFVGEIEPGRHRRVRTYTVAQADRATGEPGSVTKEEIEAETERMEELEGRIREELERSETLLDQIRREEEAQTAPDRLTKSLMAERADPRAAAETPVEIPLPSAIFDEDMLEIPPGNEDWENASKLKLTRRTLDADQDGNAEQIRYYTRKGGVLLRLEKDRNYDGRIDTWDRYEDGQISERVLDSNHDGLRDTWERYQGTRMIERTVDRDHDGVKDAFFTYRQGSLVEERHDPDNDGEIELVTTYEQRRRVRTREDSNGDGAFDIWTTYQVVKNRELPSRVERDTRADGKPNVFETYDTADGESVLSRKEEDATGDGMIDIISIYENGKLKRREISNPSLIP